MAEKAPKPEVQEEKVMNPVTNEVESPEVNKDDSSSSTKLIVVNKARPDILIDKNRVNRLRATIKGIAVKLQQRDEDGERPTDAPDTFMFNVKELIWGIVIESDGSYRFSKNSTMFPASSWGVMPTLRNDMLLSNIVDYWNQLTAINANDFTDKYGHSMDGIKIDIIQIYVPAGVEFVNPYGRENRGKAYDDDHVFTFITGFHYDLNDFNQLAFIRDIYNGSPKEIIADDGTISTILSTNNIKKVIPPRIFANSLVKNNYFGEVEDDSIKDLIEVLSY